MRKNQGIMKSFKGFLRGNKWNILPWTLGSSPRVTGNDNSPRVTGNDNSPRVTGNDNSPRVTVIPPHNIKRGLGGAYTHPQHAQSGRSMTEMLGVLAVMAVLTIGGIVGYNYAMNKHRSNVILNDVRRITVFVLSSDFMQKEDGTVQDLDVEVESDTPYEVTKESEKTFYISAGETTKRVCDILAHSKPTYAEDIIPNAMSSQICQESKSNEVFFYINTDMNGLDEDDKPEACTDSQPCTGCGECVAGRCVDSDDKCPSGKFCVNGTCGCPNDSIESTDGSCKKCGDIINVHVSSPSACTACPELNVFTPDNYVSTCVKCPAGTTYDAGDGGCTGCPSGQFWSTGGVIKDSYCSSCSWAFGVHTTKSECHKCTNAFAASGSTCYHCDVAMPGPPTTLDECNRCPKRYFDTATRICKMCPNGSRKNADGTGCTGCPASQFWNVGSNATDNQCSACSIAGGYWTTTEECHKCDTMFVAKTNKAFVGCYGCNITIEDLKSTMEECNRCPNRFFGDISGACKSCPAGQVKNKWGNGCV